MNLDGKLNDVSQDYLSYNPDTSKPLTEIAGYSNNEKVQEALENVYKKIEETFLSINLEKIHVLDIGCGPGVFLKKMNKKAILTGIDISDKMCQIAKREVPGAEIVVSHFLKHSFDKKYDFIYSVGVLIYFSRSQVQVFFKKIFEICNQDAVVLISYPHAFRKKDLFYHDYTYVHYSPEYLEKITAPYFSVLYHKHQNGSKKITDYDREPYMQKNAFDNRSYYNSSILVLRKK